MNESDLASIVWRAPEWIAALGSLRADNVLEYFSQSPFFDRRSNNAVLKMQSQFQNFGDVKEALKKMRGIEFVVSHQSPPDLFVINKQQRESYNQVTLLKKYFITNGNIYLAPDAYGIIASRLVLVPQDFGERITKNDALNEAVQFSPTHGYTYNDTIDSAAENTEEKKEDEGLDKAAQLVENRSMYKALFNTIQRTS